MVRCRESPSRLRSIGRRPLVERLAQADPYERGNYPLAGGMAYAAVAGAIETALCYISRNSPRDGCAMGDE
jgi:hypothetical protein